MKKTLSTIGLSLICGFAVHAQTTTNSSTNSVTSTNTVTSVISLPGIQLSGISSNTATEANDLVAWIEPMLPFLSNKVVSADVQGLYGQGHLGEVMDIRVPITTNQFSASIGVGEAYANTNWFIAPVSATVGTTITVPVINRKVYMFAEDGMDLQLTGNGGKGLSMGNQVEVGAFTSFDISTNLSLNVEGGYLKLSQLTGNDWMFGVSFTWHF